MHIYAIYLPFSAGKRQKRIEMQKIWLSVQKTVTFVFVVRPMLVKKIESHQDYESDKKAVTSNNSTIFLSSDLQKVVLLSRLPGYKNVFLH